MQFSSVGGRYLGHIEVKVFIYVCVCVFASRDLCLCVCAVEARIPPLPAHLLPLPECKGKGGGKASREAPPEDQDSTQRRSGNRLREGGRGLGGGREE